MPEGSFDEYVFQHLVDFLNCDCVYCSTQEKSTGRTKLFLVFNERRRIYMRSGTENSWNELKDQTAYDRVRAGFNKAVSTNRIPYFTTLSETIEDFNQEQLLN